MSLSQLTKKYSKAKLINLAKNAGWVFFDRMFRLITGLLVGVWIARYLGPSDFGLLNYVYTFPLIFSAFASLGMTGVLFNEFVILSSPDSSKKLLTSTLFVRLLAGVLAYILTLVISIFMHSDKELNLLIGISSASLIIQSFDVIDVYFQSQKIVHYSILTKLIVFLIMTLVRIYGIQHEATLLFFVTAAFLELLISSVSLLLVYIKHTNFTLSEFNIDINLLKHLLKISWPVMLSEIFLFLYVRVDLIMLKNLSSNIEVGNYSVTTRLTDVWYFIPIALTTSLSPSIINVRASDYEEYLKRYKYLLVILASLSMGLGVSMAIGADTVVYLLYGPKYKDVGSILSVNVWTSLFVFLAIGSDRWFIAENMQKFTLIRTIVGAIINVLLNLLLIPKYGALGASVATLVAQVFSSYILNGLYYKTKEIFRLQTDSITFIPSFIVRSTYQFVKAQLSL